MDYFECVALWKAVGGKFKRKQSAILNLKQYGRQSVNLNVNKSPFWILKHYGDLGGKYKPNP
jgi:hypothetical protein